MQANPVFWGACAVFALGGAIGGANIGTTPIARAEDPLGSVPQHLFVPPGPEVQQRITGSRNHYALQTPEGEVEVEDLAWHGRWRGTRMARSYASADYDFAEPEYEELDYTTYRAPPLPQHPDDPLDAVRSQSLPAHYGGAAAHHAPQPEKAEVRSEVAVVGSAPDTENVSAPPPGNARLIDVAATLAAKD